jgi:UDP-4-amino-4-deoxy-L-arabinose formyltransferase/UDP-glucuronic acid dehydrogenase (UDP-4-keto-hexauronic acid decarboxylating)
VLVAEEGAGIQALRSIAAKDGIELVAVLTGTPSGTKRGMVVADVAQKLGCALKPAQQVRDPVFAAWMRDEGVDILINVHSLYLIHGEVVDAPRIGSFNLHPGPLPGYAGLNAPSWAIFNREQRHAVTLHWMAAGLDTGAIAYETWFDLKPDATGLSCSVQCMRLGVPLVETLVTTALQEPAAIPARPQRGGGRVLYKKGDVPFGAKIDWHHPAATIDAFIRAADYHPMPSPWGHPGTIFEGAPLDVVKVLRTFRACQDAAPGTIALGENGIEVATADEWLVLQRVQQDGRVRPAAEILQPGCQLGSCPAAA